MAKQKKGCYAMKIDFIPTIGFHKVTLRNFNISIVDYDLLKSKAKVFHDSEESDYCLTENCYVYNKIQIINEDFVLKCYAYKTYASVVPVHHLTFSPDKTLELFSIEALNKYIDRICDCLKTEYGLELDTTNIRFKAYEIATQFVLDEPLTEYSRPFKILCNLNHNDKYRTMDLRKIEKDIRIWTSCLMKHNTHEMYVYDKTKQLKDVSSIYLDKNIVKIELRIEDQNCLKNVFAYPLAELTDEEVISYYKRKFNSIFKNPYLKWYKKYIENLNTLIIEYRSKHTHWITEFLVYCADMEAKGIPILLDAEDILECPCIKTDKKHFVRTKKQIENASKGYSIFNMNTQQKIKEIFSKVSDCMEHKASVIPIEVTGNICFFKY